MHLMHPAFSMSGKRKGKQKFRNADEARKARELAQEWEQKQAEWKSMAKPAKKVFAVSKPVVAQNHVRETVKVPSLNSWVTGAVNTAVSPQYTGTKIIGIGQMAKSNAVPVFNKDHIVEIARMRR